ncbi:cold-shock protein [Gordonia sp. (in: high G+C Gram-positive bacteria)]|uniref:cold-shock protein n=1 Tax=Gordonia sp. (in: high G+C Gram-positive bacteria) TaxID=84139 RepID=UPI003C7558A0
MPTGRVKWYDSAKGFGFLSQTDGEDVYVRADALPEGVGELKVGQKVEFDMAAGRRGPQALRVAVLEPAPSVARNTREAAREAGRRERDAERRSPDELHGLIADLITLLESKVQPDLRNGRYPDRKTAQRISEVVRGVTRELDR